MKYRALALFVVAFALVVAVGIATAGHGQIDQVKASTARYRDVDKAIAAGYTLRLPDTKGNTCIAQSGTGGMGVHMVNQKLLDAKLDPLKPEVIVYDPTSKKKNASLRAVAVEYVIFKSAWKGAKPPSMFGQPFDFVPKPNRYGLPAFYALHAWIWERNPSGLFFAWNPRVVC